MVLWKSGEGNNTRVIRVSHFCTHKTAGTDKKLSLTHVKEAFNSEIQDDFRFLRINGEGHQAFHIVDVGTTFSELRIVLDRKATMLK